MLRIKTARWESSILLAAIVLGLFGGAGRAIAAQLRSGSVVVIGPGEIVEDDLYVMARNLDVQGTVRGDVIVAASTVTVTGTISGDLIAAAGTVTISGMIGETARLGAGTVTFTGRIERDLVVAAGQLLVGPEARIARDGLVAASEAEFAGQLGGWLRASAGKLVLAGTIGGEAVVTTNKLRLRDGATVGGDLRYSARSGAELSSQARVQGQVEEKHAPQPAGSRVGSAVFRGLRLLVGMFLLGLILVLVFPTTARRSREMVESRPAPSFGIGLLLVFAVPIVSTLVIVLGAVIGGWWIGLMLLAVLAIAVALGFPVAALAVGDWLARRMRWAAHPLVLLLGGLVLFTLIGWVPVLGPILLSVATLLGLGGFVLGLVKPQASEPLEVTSSGGSR